MKHEGQHVSSPIPRLSINFRTSENDENTLNILKTFQINSSTNSNEKYIIEHKIFTENGAPFIYLNTNLCDKPLKFLIDTGATITILASDVITKEVTKINYIVNLFGIVGKEASVQTEGMVQSIFSISNRPFGTTLHLVDRKYSGPADGYLGYDFLSPYKVNIDLNRMCLRLSLNEIITNNENTTQIETKIKQNEACIEKYDDNYLNVLAQNYDFGESRPLGSNSETDLGISQLFSTFLRKNKNKITKYLNDNNSNETSIEPREPRNNKFGPSEPQENELLYKFGLKMPNSNENCGQNPLQLTERESYNEYYEAVNFYRQEISKFEQFKVNASEQYETTVEIYSTKPGLENRVRTIIENLKLDKCSEYEKDFVSQICNNFPYQFYLEGDILASTDVIKHKINLIPNAKVVNVRQYRIPQTHKRILQEIVEDYERQGIIEKCQSAYNSPAILVGKKDDSGGKSDFRFVVDYQKLNQMTEIYNFPIPLIDDILTGLSGCSYYTTLDIKGAFHQIVLDEASRDFTAFTAGNFQYRWIRMPMGLASAPLTWQRAINTILTELIGNGVYVYLDDVIIYAKTKSEHDKILWKVMELLKSNNLQLKISKCIFYARQFDYLGHVITEDGIKANPKKIEVIKDYPRPTTVKHIQSFLGLCSYFRRYVRNFSKIAKPLTSLLKKEQPFIWTEREQKSFDGLKKALTEEVVLAFPNFDETFIVSVDASDLAIGGFLSQGELPNDRPIYFFSKTLNEAQKRYSTIQKELLAIVETIKAFRVYLYGRFFILITDHKALCYLFNMKDCGSRLFRQKLELLDYNFKILYRPGPQNRVADALSRIEPLTIEEMLEIEKKQSCFALTRSKAAEELKKGLINVKYAIEERNGTILNKRGFDLIFHLIPTENDTLKSKIMNKFGITRFSNEFSKFQSIHYVRTISNQFANKQNMNSTQSCIERILSLSEESSAENIAVNIDFDSIRHYIYFKNLFEEIFASKSITTVFFLNKIIELKEKDDIEMILKLYHKSLLGGHVGGEKMYKTISKFYTWNGMVEDIKLYVKKCAICEKTKTTTNTKIPMQISSLGEVLFDHTYIDFVGPIQMSLDGYKYIFTAVCDLTKFLVAVPTKDCTALAAAESLLESIICRYNIPTRLISDNATSFLSQVIKELTRLFAIKKISTTIYHPQGNIVERSHRTLNAYLRAFTSKNRDQWSELLKFATFAYNNTIHSTTGYTPHELAHGFKIQIPNQLTKPKLTYNYDNYADMTRNNIAKALEIAREHLHNRKLQNKRYYDSNASDYDIQVNDMVLVKSQVKKHKFQDVYDGPYRVIDSSDSYIEILKNGKKTKLHKNLVKKAQAQYDKEPPMTTPVISLDDLNDQTIQIIFRDYSIQI